MIRVPLRPLARILPARANGENPDAIERENKRIRHEEMRDRMRARAESRLLILGMFFVCAFVVGAARLCAGGVHLGGAGRYCGPQRTIAGHQL